MGAVAAQTVFLSPPLAVTPQPQAMWMIELATIKAQTFRVLQVTQSDRAEYDVTATAYNPSKYGYIDNGTVLSEQSITDLTLPVAAPRSLACTESLYSYQSTIFSMAALSWQGVPNANAYFVAWSKDGGPWQYATVPTSEFDLRKTDPGTYDFRVWSIGPAQNKSATYAEINTTLYGKTLPPSDIVGLNYGFDPSNGLILSWEAATDIDLSVYEIRQGATWSSATLSGQSKSTMFTVGTANLAGSTFLVAVLDTQGVYSANPQSISPVVIGAPAPAVSAVISGVNAVISWVAVSGSLNTDHYEIRTDANFGNPVGLVGTVKGTTLSFKVSWAGARTFYVAAVDIGGNVGASGNASLTISPPTAPAITQQVIDNNVLLKWTPSSATLPVDHYIVAKGATWAGSTLIGNATGTFDVIFETAAGNFTYWVCGVDSAGNQGAPVGVSIFVNPPPDYVLHYNLDSVFGGTKTNIATDTDGITLIAPVDTTTAYQAHFTGHSWTSPQDQVTAGYPLFIEPAPLTASYLEAVDYGAILPASNIVISPSITVISGAPVLQCTIAVSADNSTWTTYTNTTNVFVTNFRYLKVTLNITGTAGLDVLQLTGLNIKYQVKQKTDSGIVTCNASDTSGTTVNFNVSFLDITSLTVTANGTAATFAVNNFTYPAYPTSFQVLLFDANGNRVSGTASWNARGV
jgi:hypothetical protein